MIKSRDTRNARVRTALLLFGVTVAVLAAACSSLEEQAVPTVTGLDSPLPALDDLPEGASVVFESDTELWVAFRDGDEVVHLQGLIGPEREETGDDEAGDPWGLGRYEVDVRILDIDGIPFVTDLDGHDFADPAWADALYYDSLDVDEERRDSDYSLAARAANEVFGSEIAERFPFVAAGWQSSVAFDLDAQIDPWSEDDYLVGTAPAPEGWLDDETETVDAGGDEDDMARSWTGYRHKVQLRWDWCCNAFGHHSAIRVYIYNSSGRRLATRNTGNHGRRASHPDMNTGKQRGWNGRSNFEPTIRGYADTSPGRRGGGCHTSYGWSPPPSGDNGKHVCHDDSVAEWANVAQNQTGTWGHCADNNLRQYRPNQVNGNGYLWF